MIVKVVRAMGTTAISTTVIVMMTATSVTVNVM